MCVFVCVLLELRGVEIQSFVELLVTISQTAGGRCLKPPKSRDSSVSS